LPRNPLHPGNYAIHAVLFARGQTLDALLNVAVWESGVRADDMVGARDYGACREPVTMTVRCVKEEAEALPPQETCASCPS
jgi:hypothetical protein